jgi:hypothetical protein
VEVVAGGGGGRSDAASPSTAALGAGPRGGETRWA